MENQIKIKNSDENFPVRKAKEKNVVCELQISREKIELTDLKKALDIPGIKIKKIFLI